MRNPANRLVGWASRACWTLGAAALALASVAGPARSAPPDVQLVGTLQISLPPGFSPDNFRPNTALILDSPRRRAYQIMKADAGQTVGRVIDLESSKILYDKPLSFADFPRGPYAPNVGGVAAEWVHVFDPENATIYIAFLDTNGVFGGINALHGPTMTVKKHFLRPLTNVDPDSIGCTSGSCLPQLPTVAPSIKGLSIVPSELTGNPTKLLLWMEEPKPVGTERNFNVAWLAQWDARTGKQDWIYRVSACSNAGFPSGQYQLGVFYARLGSGVYVACAAGGGTGQVVRIIFDGNGRPDREQAYPGPLGMTDAIADAEDDRMLLKVTNVEGESWWVFDGSSSAYTGVIGVTIGLANTAAGLDPTTGRLYVVAPTTDNGTQVSVGGFLMSDVRRAPAPQMLAFEEYRQAAVGSAFVDIHPVTGERFVYVRPFGKLSYLIFKDNVPISSDPPIEDQDRLTLPDVTLEDPAIHGHNFGGSGHAYGVRALLPGGANGFVPTGPDLNGIRVGRHIPTWLNSPCGPGDRELVVGSIRDAGMSNEIASAGATVAEADPGTKTDLFEPTARCYPRPTDTQGRDIWDQLVDAIRQVSPDVADRIKDYPRPLERELDDKKTGSPDDPRTDEDEILGTPWPFGIVECAGDRSGDEKGSTDTRVRPLDRGDEQTGPIPSDLRSKEIVVEGARATVDCRYSKARVEATSEILLREERLPAVEIPNVPKIGTIRVGEISARTVLYLDPVRGGLVARSEATAREISIGDEIFIDKAFTIGEAWAAGHAGYAGTNFFRRICGVRIRDQAPDRHVYRPSVEVDPEHPERSKVDPQGGGEQSKSADLDACGDPQQPALGQTPVIDAINRVLGARGRASAPQPDGKLRQGSLGGYLASIQKDRFEAISSRAVNNDVSTQVPAFELIIFNDDPTEGRGRQIYQFAGVDASVTYGLYLLNPAEEFPPDDFEEQLITFTGGTPGADFPEPTGGGGPPPGRGPLRILFSGLSFLLRSPKDALLAAAVWLVLFSPVRLSARRRALRRLAA